MDAIEKAEYVNIVKYVEELSGAVAAVGGLGSIGIHSPLTSLMHYQPSTTVGSKSVPEMKSMSSKLTDALLTLFFRFPFRTTRQAHSQGLPSVVFDSMPSIRQRLIDAGQHELDNIDQVWTFLLDKLREDFDMDDWLCNEQGEAALMNFTSNMHSLIVTPCGSGKTITFLLPYLQAPSGITVVILPYVALCQKMFEDTSRRFPNTCLLFQPRLDAFKAEAFSHGLYQPGGPYGSIRFIFVVTDTAVSHDALSFLQAASNYGRLNAIVMDEVHQVVLSETFRPVMGRLGVMFAFGVKVIMLSGTLPSCLEKSLFRSLCIGPRSVKIIRKNDTYGKRLIVNLLQLHENDEVGNDFLADYLKEHIVKRRLQKRPGDVRPFVVFGLTKASTKQLRSLVKIGLESDDDFSQAFTTVCLTSETKGSERARFFQELDAPTNNQLVLAFATSAAAEGADFKNVGTVVVLGGCFGGVLLLHQILNRAGRGRVEDDGHDQAPAESFLVYSPWYIQKRLGDKADIHDTKLLSFIVRSDRAQVRKLGTVKALKQLFKRGNQHKCGGRVMEKLLGNPVLSDHCGRCAGCMKDDLDGVLPSITFTPAIEDGGHEEDNNDTQDEPTMDSDGVESTSSSLSSDDDDEPSQPGSNEPTIGFEEVWHFDQGSSDVNDEMDGQMASGWLVQQAIGNAHNVTQDDEDMEKYSKWNELGEYEESGSEDNGPSSQQTLPSAPTEGNNGAKKVKLTETEEVPIQPAIIREQQKMERELTHEVMRYFKAKDSAYCICCGGLCQFPNRCELTMSLAGYSEDKCGNCFNLGHYSTWEDFRDVRLSLRRSGDDEKQAAEKMYHSNKVKQCIAMVKDCEEWTRFKACTRCCLQHSTRICPLPNIHLVRHVIILVWNDIWLRQQLGEMEKCHHHIQRFEEFTRWVFYSGHSQVQNAWRLLAFFIATREAWLKRKGVWHLVK